MQIDGADTRGLVLSYREIRRFFGDIDRMKSVPWRTPRRAAFRRHKGFIREYESELKRNEPASDSVFC